MSFVLLIISLIIIFLICCFYYKKNKKTNYEVQVDYSILLKEVETEINDIHRKDIFKKLLSFCEAKKNRQQLIFNWETDDTTINKIKEELRKIIVIPINYNLNTNNQRFEQEQHLQTNFQSILKNFFQKIKQEYVNYSDDNNLSENKKNSCITIFFEMQIEDLLSNLNQCVQSNTTIKNDLDSKLNELIKKNKFYKEFQEKQKEVENSLLGFEKEVNLKAFFIIKQHFLKYKQFLEIIFKKKEFILNNGFSPNSYQIFQEKALLLTEQEKLLYDQYDQLNPNLQLQINQLKYIITSITSYLGQIDVIIKRINTSFDEKRSKTTEEIRECNKQKIIIPYLRQLHTVLFSYFRLPSKVINDLDSGLEHKWGELPNLSTFQQNSYNNIIIDYMKDMTNEKTFRQLCQKLSNDNISYYYDKSFSTFPYEESNFILNSDIENENLKHKFDNEIILKVFQELQKKNNQLQDILL
ncbi:hypothetical protein [Candidatus Phytoplasma mali]|uniref:hypothetical protein n=1 Tax=Apple proliferation phytoplasma TaxID=37692 RepID=UPI0011D0406F|nr:hypothetical protein [Candidatus Phytoplasma mali]